MEIQHTFKYRSDCVTWIANINGVSIGLCDEAVRELFDVRGRRNQSEVTFVVSDKRPKDSQYHTLQYHPNSIYGRRYRFTGVEQLRSMTALTGSQANVLSDAFPGRKTLYVWAY